MTGAVVAWVLPVVLDLASLLGIVIAALGSLVVVAAIAVYLLQNRPRAFLSFRKLRLEPERDDDREE